MAGLKFAPWSSDIELSFYAALASLKINHDKLDDAARKIVGRYEVRPNDKPERSTRMQIHGNAFTTDEMPHSQLRAEGILKNFNTIEDYKGQDRAAVVERAGRTIWDAIIDGTVYSCPSLLSSFYALFFADLKKYRFTYHFLFPALHSDPPWQVADGSCAISKLTPQETTFLFDAVQTWKYSVDQRQHGFFLAKRKRFHTSSDNAEIEGDADSSQEDLEQRPTTPRTPKPEDLGFRWAVGSLSSFESGFFKSIDPEDCFVCFADPSTFPKNPGWMLRNLLVLIRQRWHLEEVQILCYRDTHLRRDQANSVILNLKSSGPSSTSTSSSNVITRPMPKVTGWERNAQDKLNSNVVTLADYMDPRRLADQSVDLNLKLMKWRIAPDLDLDVIKNTKCLLLGAGTLGSYVSRNLLGWGVRKITFVDNATVSYSNPVRQPLFTFKDCQEGGAKKALRAAETLSEVYPGVQSKGYVMSVPMAGHPITDEQAVKEDYDTLRDLVDEHDVIFLLMDTRESRWLPTVMGKSTGKIVMNAALGFDTYVVMRHGGKAQNVEEEPQLGCYFCNDVVAPADSIADRTLDQQCTVTRPGVAAIASALLVELLISVLQHPLRARAGAPANRSSDRGNHPLGLVPHQIRGFLSAWDNMLIKGPNYDCCSACSNKIVEAYEKDGWGFVKRALNERGYVEELSGLAEVQRKAEEADRDIEFDEEDDGIADDEEPELL